MRSRCRFSTSCLSVWITRSTKACRFGERGHVFLIFQELDDPRLLARRKYAPESAELCEGSGDCGLTRQPAAEGRPFVVDKFGHALAIRNVLTGIIEVYCRQQRGVQFATTQRSIRSLDLASRGRNTDAFH